MNPGPKKVQKVRSIGLKFLDSFYKFHKIREDLRYEI